MNIISAKSIENAFNFFENEGDETVIAYNESIFKKHDNLIQFMSDTVNTFFQKEEDVMNNLYDVFYYFSVFIKSFENEGYEINNVDNSLIDELSETFPAFIEEYYEEADPNIILSYVNQPYLIDFLLYELSDENEDNSFDDNQSNLIFMAGISLISLLDKASKVGKK